MAMSFYQLARLTPPLPDLPLIVLIRLNVWKSGEPDEGVPEFMRGVWEEAATTAAHAPFFYLSRSISVIRLK